jgi:cytochrome c-type biogenesis protein CcmF
MIAELGHFALALAIAVAVFQSVIPLIGAQTGNDSMMRAAIPAAHLQAVFVSLAFAALTYLHVTSDFSVLNVVQNSHTAKPMLYKGNHEGSMLLWALILAVFGAAVAAFGKSLPRDLRSRAIAVQGMLGVAFLLFIILTSNPFLRLENVPLDGNDLNPLLQDPGLAFHPPLLYAGYVGFSVAFSFAIAALIGGKVDAAWARWVRPWTLAAWINLTLGIALGSYWAYYELGWGGWWYWDPVENASFMPWLVGTALLHSSIVVEKRGTLKAWTIFLSILAFSLSLLGTFLVRSGVLTSVHAFAVDPARGVFILIILIIVIGGSLGLYAWRAPSLKGGGLFAPISREGGLVFNNLILAVATGVVLVGTIYPLLGQALGFKLSVGAPFFNMTFGPLVIPLLIAVPFGSILAWKRGDLLAATQRLYAAFAASVLVVILFLVFAKGVSIFPIFGVALATWLMVGSLCELAARVKLFRVPVATSWSRAVGLPRATYGMVIAHFGLGLSVLGIVGISSWRAEDISVMFIGDTTTVAGFEIQLTDVSPFTGENYDGHRGTFVATKNGQFVTNFSSERRVYWVTQMPTTEVGLRTTAMGDLYVVLGDPQGTTINDGWVVRVYYNPLVSWIWLGALVMSIGGVISLTDRRFRIGLPVRARAKGAAAAAASA